MGLRNMKRKNKWSSLKKNSINLLLIILSLISLFMFTKNSYSDIKTNFQIYQAKTKFQLIKKLSNSVNSDPDIRLETNFHHNNLLMSNVNNEDIGLIGWIKIKDSRIDYPVMFTPNDPEYYLSKGLDKRYSKNGVPFVGADCEITPRSDNIIIFGHNMNNGMMFSDLILYSEKSYWKSHSLIEFESLYEKSDYEIFLVFKIRMTEIVDFPFHQYINFEQTIDFEEFLSKGNARALYSTGIKVDHNDTFLTLSTCDSTSDIRIVIVSRRIVN